MQKSQLLALMEPMASSARMRGTKGLWLRSAMTRLHNDENPRKQRVQWGELMG